MGKAAIVGGAEDEEFDLLVRQPEGGGIVGKTTAENAVFSWIAIADLRDAEVAKRTAETKRKGAGKVILAVALTALVLAVGGLVAVLLTR